MVCVRDQEETQGIGRLDRMNEDSEIFTVSVAEIVESVFDL